MRGNVYKIIGDAFQAAFEISSQAVQAALAAQRALAAEAWPTSAPLRARMGLHVGYAIVQGDDYATTHTLNRVARFMSAAHGGQILLSEAVAELTRDDLSVDVSLRDMGQRGAIAYQLECFAFIAIAQKQNERAARLFGAAEAWREQGGTSMTPVEQIEYQQQE